MTPFLGRVMRKEETAVCPPGNSKSILLKANRRFFLPPYEPKQYVIPNEAIVNLINT